MIYRLGRQWTRATLTNNLYNRPDDHPKRYSPFHQKSLLGREYIGLQDLLSLDAGHMPLLGPFPLPDNHIVAHTK